MQRLKTAITNTTLTLVALGLISIGPALMVYSVHYQQLVSKETKAQQDLQESYDTLQKEHEYFVNRFINEQPQMNLTPKQIKAWINAKIQDRQVSKLADGLISAYANHISNSKYPLIALAIIYEESRLDQKAKSRVIKAIGPAQINPIHIAELKSAGIIHNKDDLMRVSESIKALEYILDLKLKTDKSSGDLSVALDMYSGGAKGYANKVTTTMAEIYLSSIESKDVVSL